ncbi:hypothetical protein SETIT_8G126700v2 [Setaria italica]|uniref:Uncharacterized protein n=1 Tax=Setaria italica TaxID=4555 RepID=A0A368S761_SETIT|nr:hypothetical protein SETIT_8G126700v2 [Setaria italica]
MGKIFIYMNVLFRGFHSFKSFKLHPPLIHAQTSPYP